jgi:hypothetical protein
MRGEQDDADANAQLRLMTPRERNAARRLVRHYLPSQRDDCEAMARIAEL